VWTCPLDHSGTISPTPFLINFILLASPGAS